jgi:hypothetical protein
MGGANPAGTVVRGLRTPPRSSAIHSRDAASRWGAIHSRDAAPRSVAHGHGTLDINQIASLVVGLVSVAEGLRECRDLLEHNVLELHGGHPRSGRIDERLEARVPFDPTDSMAALIEYGDPGSGIGGGLSVGYDTARCG